MPAVPISNFASRFPCPRSCRVEDVSYVSRDTFQCTLRMGYSALREYPPGVGMSLGRVSSVARQPQRAQRFGLRVEQSWHPPRKGSDGGGGWSHVGIRSALKPAATVPMPAANRPGPLARPAGPPNSPASAATNWGRWGYAGHWPLPGACPQACGGRWRIPRVFGPHSAPAAAGGPQASTAASCSRSAAQRPPATGS